MSLRSFWNSYRQEEKERKAKLTEEEAILEDINKIDRRIERCREAIPICLEKHGNRQLLGGIFNGVKEAERYKREILRLQVKKEKLLKQVENIKKRRLNAELIELQAQKNFLKNKKGDDTDV